MSFRLFIYTCAVWGAAAAYFGWAAGRALEVEAPLGAAAVKGLALGLFVALGLGLVDALAVSDQRDVVQLGLRLTLAVLIGAVGGLVGGFLGEALTRLWSALLVLGWVLTGLLIGSAPAAFDVLAAVMRNEERRGVLRKMRNGLIGGAVGGLAGGILYTQLRAVWIGVFKDAEAHDLWSPSATGFVALGACIGLAVPLAQIILREAWLRVEAGFRPGRQLLLTRPETTIGRAESCDVGLFGDAAVEKLHAKIVRQGGQWLLVDVGTAGGTLLNGQKIAGPTALRSADRIQVGNSVLSFGVRAKEAAVAATATAPA